MSNDAQRLRRCLDSIVSSHYPRALIEMIVIDNHSTDGSGRIARECGAVVLRRSQGSVAELRNCGARAALGTILAFAASDHEIDPHWIETAVDALSTPVVAWLASGNLAVKRAAFQAVGGFRPESIAGEDVDLCDRLIGAGRHIIADAARAYAGLAHASQQTRRSA